MPTVFVSYRRKDAVDITCHLFDRLQQALGRDAVFIDQETIRPGVDFEERIREALKEYLVFLVVIGPQWVTIKDANGHRRLDKLDDWVRREVEDALSKPGVRVIPVLVGDARMPQEEEFPEPLRRLLKRNPLTIRSGFLDSIGDMTRLTEEVKAIIKEHEDKKLADEEKRRQQRVADVEFRNRWRTGILYAIGIPLVLVALVTVSWLSSKMPQPAAPTRPDVPDDSPPSRPPHQRSYPPPWQVARVQPELALFGGVYEAKRREDVRLWEANPFLAIFGGAVPSEAIFPPLLPLDEDPLFRP